MNRLIIILLLGCVGNSANAQEIVGRILDEKLEPVIGATVWVYGDPECALKNSAVTDFDGNYVVKPLDPGMYEALILAAEYDSLRITNIMVAPHGSTVLSYRSVLPITGSRKCVTVQYYRPLVSQPPPRTKGWEELKPMPFTIIKDYVE